jgi:biotin carboxyl carrier protein
MLLVVTIDGKPYRVELTHAENGWACRLDSKDVKVNAVLVRPDVLSLIVNGCVFDIRREVVAGGLQVCVGDAKYAAEVRDPRSLRGRRQAAGANDGVQKLMAPIPGKVVRVLAPEKSQVRAGQGVLVVEAMKMQNEVKSPKQGVVQKIFATEGTAVNTGDVLAVVE